MMPVQLDVHVDDPDERRSLRDWLTGEPAVRQHGALRTHAVPRPGHLGALELISLAVGTGLSVAQLVLAIAQWRDTRPRTPAVTVTIGGEEGDGRAAVRIESSDPQAVAAVVRALENG